MKHITEEESIAKQLKDLGEPISETDVIDKIICTLPKKFRFFLPVWDSIPETEKTVSLLSSRLMKEEITSKRFETKKPDDMIDNALCQRYQML